MAQFENTDVGARAIGMNGAFTALSNSSIAAFYNPSGLGQIKYREFSVYYSPSVFGLGEISTGAASIAEPFGFGTAALSLKTFGFELYRETVASLSFGSSYRGRFFYGANINCYSLSIKNYGSAVSFGMDAGGIAYVTGFLRWGFAAKNITGSKIGKSESEIAQVYRTGIGISPREDLCFLAELEKDVRFPLSLRCGMEYSLSDNFEFRAGAGTEPVSFSCGVGISYDKLELEYSVRNVQPLGITNEISLSVNFGGAAARNYYREQLSKAFK